MKRKSYLIVVLFLIFEMGYSQITNTRHWRKTEKDSLDDALLLYEEKNYLIALPKLEQIHKHHLNENFIKYLYGKCAMYRTDKHDEAYQTLFEVYEGNKRVDQIEFDLAKAAHNIGYLPEASTYVEAYLKNKHSTPEGKKEAEQLLRYINYAKLHTASPTKAKITNIGNVINTEDDEYVPCITADESVLIYTTEGVKSKGGRQNAFLQPDPNGAYTEDVYMSVKQDDKFQAPVSLENINTNAHDAAISLSNDGQILFIYRDNGDDHGDIYQSFLVGETFSAPVKLKGQVNSYSWDGHCSLSPDGQTLYFSSERSGGYGGKDIYKATFMPDSTWGNVVNLGDSINTKFDDDAPFIHPDGITLYYSSKGRTSMGGFDIFQSTMAIGDSVFRISENLGYPINSTLDDIYFVLSAYGNTGYYSSDKKGTLGLKDVFQIETNFDKPKALYLVKGKTTLNNAGVETKIVVEVTSKNNKVFKSINSNATSGKYILTLPAGDDYKITYTYKDKPSQTLTLSTIGIAGYNEKINDLSFGTLDTAKVAVTPTVAVVTPTSAVVTNTAPVGTETFVPKNKLQAKTIANLDKYGDISAEGLEFRVQIAAYKFPKNYLYGHLRKLGKVDHLLLEDGITRITIGGKFATMRKAWEHNKKVVGAGQTDAFVTALYKGQRITIEKLVQMGIFVVK